VRKTLLAALALVVAAALARGLLGAATAGISTESTLSAPARQLPSTDSSLQAKARNPKWAVPIERPGLPNFFKVSDDLYRGAQPTAEGFRELEKMGVKTDVNLRSFHSDSSLLEGTKLGYENINVKAWHAEDEDLVRFLKIVTDKKNTPVFVHCQYGADRTGMVVAVYRMAVQGWTKDEAIEEMTQGGFGFHKTWENLVTYLRKLDVDALKRAAGLGGAHPKNN